MISNMMLQAQVTEEQLKKVRRLKQKQEWFCLEVFVLGGNIQ